MTPNEVMKQKHTTLSGKAFLVPTWKYEDFSISVNDDLLDVQVSFFVYLASCGNPDFFQDPDKEMFGSAAANWRMVSSLSEASKVCSDFIRNNNLGSSNWAGGEIVDQMGNMVARVSYNGRVWKGK